MQAVILAAGRGKRLHPLTLTRSKAMMPVWGKPMLDRVLDSLAHSDLGEFIIVTSPQDSEIRRYFLEHSRPGISLEWVVQPEPLGMAQALSLAAPSLRGSFLLSSCDNLTRAGHVADLLAQHESHSANATLSLMEIDPASAGTSSTVEFHQGQVRGIVEKPAPGKGLSNIASLPLYVFSSRLLDCLSDVPLSPSGEYQLQDAIQVLIERNGKVTGVFTPSRLQLTHADDLLTLNRYYMSRDSDPACVAPAHKGSGTKFVPPVGIEAGTVIGSNCTIGPAVYIESDCHIGAHVSLKDAVILRGSRIEEGRQVAGKVLAPEASPIGEVNHDG
ncbi:MAG: sugar phosphate nucleotidyltransferase [Acidobacteria bacterium]|nr:sugar phosphate nucleotidyltransferase [Acidobacteriota bacterium]